MDRTRTTDPRVEEAALVGGRSIEDDRHDAAVDRGRELMAAWAAEDADEPAEVVDLRAWAGRRRRAVGRAS